ncbi:hypothetical protein B0T26DRAFT_721758 [Lasiosphaeria miniovina]|uniref:Uncharacterized protein n=1 Tax=Lasiosphaeria miniovina TaxID=1954250 RepID=A0AA40DQ96_9PEZI|nr:uncharacterized protein B0T26DRAFT_721758 [Lasiosphaeria miniovina]KAK0709491.1 hypothetical protein B0T26DRAFT_721758 [Lasiosphaeria miniovina]
MTPERKKVVTCLPSPLLLLLVRVLWRLLLGGELPRVDGPGNPVGVDHAQPVRGLHILRLHHRVGAQRCLPIGVSGLRYHYRSRHVGAGRPRHHVAISKPLERRPGHGHDDGRRLGA